MWRNTPTWTVFVVVASHYWQLVFNYRQKKKNINIMSQHFSFKEKARHGIPKIMYILFLIIYIFWYLCSWIVPLRRGSFCKWSDRMSTLWGLIFCQSIFRLLYCNCSNGMLQSHIFIHGIICPFKKQKLD